MLAVTITVGACVTIAVMTLGKGGRSLGHAFAELRVDGPDGQLATGARRVARGALVVGVFGLLASWSVPAAVVAIVAAWLPSVVRADRRGPLEWATGLTDYAVAPMPNQRVAAPTEVAPDPAARRD